MLVTAGEAVGAVAMLAVAAWCWTRGVSRSEFEPVVPGAPPFTSVDYSGTWIGVAFAAVLAAGLLALDAGRRRRRASTHRGYHG
ncbi:hypothetical protein C8K36_101273 [Rhodococcus sp. OK519]|nr:hypothetical protein C8K36_101273 [Rhodococcus sp. OK519]